MNIAILSAECIKRNHRMKRAEEYVQARFEELGHRTQILQIEHCAFYVSRETKTYLAYRGLLIKELDLIIGPEIMIPEEQIVQRTILFDVMLRHFELTGTIIVNPWSQTSLLSNKLHAIAYLMSRGIPVPKTASVKNINGLPKVIHSIGGLPVILRRCNQKKPREMIVCESMRCLETWLDVAFDFEGGIFLQEYVPECDREFTRVMVVDNIVVGCLRIQLRSQNSFECSRWTVQVIESPSKEIISLAKETINIFGLVWGGVDIVQQSGRMLVDNLAASPLIRTDFVCTDSSRLKEMEGAIVDEVVKAAVRRVV